MTAEEKREKNREYYERRKEELRKKARERYRKLKLVEDPPEKMVSVEKSSTLEIAPASVRVEAPEDSKKKTPCGSLVRKTRRPICLRPKKQTRSPQSLSAEKLKEAVLRPSENGLSDYGSGFFSISFQLSDGVLPMATNFQQVPIAMVPEVSEADAEKKTESGSSSTWKQKFSVSYFLFFSQFFRILFGAGLTGLLILLQIEFYEAHDPSKYSVALAIACELCLIALSMTRFRGLFTEGIKRLTYIGLFCYVIGSLGFASYHSQREQLQENKPASQSKEHLIQSLKQAERSLAQATRHRSWDNMKLFGSEVQSLRKEIKEYQEPEAMGFSNEEIAFFTALLFIILRAGFVIVNV
ncbi:MAG: hypothetical protein HRU19_30195 [Pseudobacteriovorax sp.]|nr:hypothetical protein [Pseudobacteriovorax sp.]